MKILFLMLSIIIFIQSCASTTVLEVDDPEVKIFRSDKLLGQGTALFTSRSLAWSNRDFTLKKDGCRNQNYILRRDDHIDVSALIFGLFLIVPLGWIMKYEAKKHIIFECSN